MSTRENPLRQHPEERLRGAHEVQDIRVRWLVIVGCFEGGGDFVEGPADGGEGLAGWKGRGGEHCFERGDYAAETVALEARGWVA